LPKGFRYQPFYCDENAWWLCSEPAVGLDPRDVIFVLSRAGCCPVAAQRAVAPGALCWWDYHVVVLDGSRRVWDLDTRLGCPLPAADWLAGSFPQVERLPALYRPLFRVVPAARYRAEFASDRSHMRAADGGWLHPPPPWPIIGEGMRLYDYLSMGPEGPGELMDYQQFLAHIAD
jgi:hypothetical protein